MARKMMVREVTITTVKSARIVMQDGESHIDNLPDEVLIGNITLEKAQKEITKQYGVGVTVLGVQADTKTYEMGVDDFIKHASIREPKPEPENPDIYINPIAQSPKSNKQNDLNSVDYSSTGKLNK